MNQTKKDKEFIMEYINAISGKTKTRELLEKYNADQGLIETIMFFDSVRVRSGHLFVHAQRQRMKQNSRIFR